MRNRKDDSHRPTSKGSVVERSFLDLTVRPDQLTQAMWVVVSVHLSLVYELADTYFVVLLVLSQSEGEIKLQGLLAQEFSKRKGTHLAM
jgi:hypothetical protein